MAITFQNLEIDFKLSGKLLLRRWIREELLAEKRKPGQINFVFTSDEELLGINIRYLNHHTYTDIITFDYSRHDTVAGDIMISVDRVRENAAKFKVDPETELRRVIIHGVLHLCGYKDKTKAAAAKMRARENKALARFEKNLNP